LNIGLETHGYCGERSADMALSLDELLRKNVEAFGEREPNRRRAIMSEIWAANGEFVDPDGRHVGLQAIDEAVERLLQRFPDFVFSELGAPDIHNEIGRLAWGFGPPGAKPVVTGLDVIVSKAGRIDALYTFLDPHQDVIQ
jgi:hypothetical protein